MRYLYLLLSLGMALLSLPLAVLAFLVGVPLAFMGAATKWLATEADKWK